MHGPDTTNKPWAGRAALGAVLALAMAVRLVPWPQVFTPAGVALMADGDTYYHALRAERLARDWPHVPWTDAGMNHPLGADVPWPPLLDQVVATATVATGPVTPDRVAGVAALVPPVAGVLLVAVTAGLAGAMLGGAVWWDAALLVALLPAAVRQSFVGRPDHHVLEALLSALAYLIYLAGLREGRKGALWPVLLGAALATTFWNWSGSALYLGVLALHVGLLHVVSRAGDPAPGRAARLLAGGAGVAAILLAVTIAAWGPPGGLARPGLTPITGLAVAMCVGTALGAGVLAASRHWRPAAGVAGRIASLAVAAAAPALLVLVAPSGMRAGIVHGLTALGASSAWYASIGEFWPLLGSGRQPWTLELWFAAIAYGIVPLLLPVAAVLLVRQWRAHPERRAWLAFLAAWSVVTLGLAVLQRRFEGYAALPLAVAGAWVVRGGTSAAIRRWPAVERWAIAPRVAALVLLVGPGLLLLPVGAVAELPAGAADKFPLLRYLRELPLRPGREGVLASWSDGHEIQWMARKPVLSTPFGTDIDPRSMQDEAAFRLEADPAAVEELLRRRQVGWLLLDNPVRAVATLQPFAPGKPVRAVEERSVTAGSQYAFYPELFDLVGSRLYFLDGNSERGDLPALGAYRLVAESNTPVEVLGHRAQAYKLFEVVPGARLAVRGLTPGTEVVAAVTVKSNVGRLFQWATRAAASADGEAILRVPYATGRNGAGTAGPYRLQVGGREVPPVPVAEERVMDGGVVVVGTPSR